MVRLVRVLLSIVVVFGLWQTDTIGNALVYAASDFAVLAGIIIYTIGTFVGCWALWIIWFGSFNEPIV